MYILLLHKVKKDIWPNAFKRVCEQKLQVTLWRLWGTAYKIVIKCLKHYLNNPSRVLHQLTGIFIAETSHASVRRILGPFQNIGASFGALLSYTTTAFLPWRMCKLILSLVVTLPAAFAILLCEETPHWLVKKGMIDEARYVARFCVPLVIKSIIVFCFRQSMAFYRGKEFHSQENELQSIIEREGNEASSPPNKNFFGRLQILKSPAFLRPFKCVGVIYILLNLSGIFIIASYSATFLEARRRWCMLFFATEFIIISKT